MQPHIPTARSFLAAQVLANAYIREVPAVAMSFKQKNAGPKELQVRRGADVWWLAAGAKV